jgi:hypothetical protein
LALEECEILTVSRYAVDLREQAAVNHWLQQDKPDDCRRHR